MKQFLLLGSHELQTILDIFDSLQGSSQPSRFCWVMIKDCETFIAGPASSSIYCSIIRHLAAEAVHPCFWTRYLLMAYKALLGFTEGLVPHLLAIANKISVCSFRT